MPKDAEALRNLGAALHDRGLWDEALPTLQAALALEPEHPAALVDAADSMRGLGRVREAVPLYQKALGLNAQDVEALNNLGNAYLELADHQRALEHYELRADCARWMRRSPATWRTRCCCWADWTRRSPWGAGP